MIKAFYIVVSMLISVAVVNLNGCDSWLSILSNKQVSIAEATKTNSITHSVFSCKLIHTENRSKYVYVVSIKCIHRVPLTKTLSMGASNLAKKQFSLRLLSWS